MSLKCPMTSCKIDSLAKDRAHKGCKQDRAFNNFIQSKYSGPQYQITGKKKHATSGHMSRTCFAYMGEKLMQATNYGKVIQKKKPKLWLVVIHLYS